jgi:hypothetical protein
MCSGKREKEEQHQGAQDACADLQHLVILSMYNERWEWRTGTAGAWSAKAGKIFFVRC